MAAPDPQLHIATLQRELAWAHLKIQALQAELRQERILKYGPRSETLSDLPTEVTGGEPACRARKWRPKRGARRPGHFPARAQGASRTPTLPENLPRVEEVIPCAEQHCKACGAETTVIGYDEASSWMWNRHAICARDQA